MDVVWDCAPAVRPTASASAMVDRANGKAVACHLLPLSNSNSACSRVSLRSIPWNRYAGGHLPRHHRRALRSSRMRATLSDLGTDSFRLPRDRAAQGIMGCLPAPTRARRPPAVRSAHVRSPAKVPGPAHCRHIGGGGPHRRSDAIVKSHDRRPPSVRIVLIRSQARTRQSCTRSSASLELRSSDPRITAQRWDIFFQSQCCCRLVARQH